MVTVEEIVHSLPALPRLAQMRASALREVAIRRSVYPGLVSRGRMRPGEMEHEIDLMNGIVALLDLLIELERQRQRGAH